MIKRLLFDIDNTIIEWKEEYRYLSLKEAGINDTIDMQNISKLIDNYDSKHEIMVKRDLINEITTLGIDKDKAYNIVELDCNRYEIPSKEIFDLFDYLSSKYELVIVTNWFSDIQSKRLESMGLIKYFKEIYSADQYKSKPNKEIFINACGDYKKEECLMIGDSIEKDIEGALNAGIDAIHVNHSDIKSEYKEIKNIIELKEML